MHDNGEWRYLLNRKYILRNQTIPDSLMARRGCIPGNTPYNSGGKRILKLKVQTELMDSYPNTAVWGHG